MPHAYSPRNSSVRFENHAKHTPIALPAARESRLRGCTAFLSDNNRLSQGYKASASPDNTRPQGCKKAVSGYAGFLEESLAEMAKILTQHIKDYKIDTQMQQDRETGLLVNFIQDMESKFKAQVDALGLGAFVERLKAANESVRALTAQHTAKTASAREASDEAYKTLVQHVNAHAFIEGEAAYSAFIDYANTEIEYFKKEVVK